MGHDNWVRILIRNNTGSRLVFRNAVASWGKFYIDDHKWSEITADQLHQRQVPAYGTGFFWACGRHYSPSGCAGRFHLENSQGIYVAAASYSDPFRGLTSFRVYPRGKDAGFMATGFGWDRHGDRTKALGDVILTIDKI